MPLHSKALANHVKQTHNSGLDSVTEQGTSKGFQPHSLLTNTPGSQSGQSDHCINTNNADNLISDDIS